MEIDSDDAHIVTPKFYQKLDKEDVSEELVEEYLKKLKVVGPREKYEYFKTENQKYGWYQMRLTDADMRDRRLNFHKRTNIIIKEHLMNYAKIRD
ncbi:hypothetical protein NQ317_009747 [Molorchus minor]|uniref:Uncharacterized protein n=1 Tax=Molorchus minor TaxID=1323400 RepID=A0ABQ9IYL4_9CUCU|nr:hypothetical protein NQ317_009747 [Molorchus minor]